jgi:Mlc titration factor MtfA (ptsG expression regulator)
MDTTSFFVFVAGAILLFLLVKSVLKKKAPVVTQTLPADYPQLLEQNVLFYQKLTDEQKQQFNERVQHFVADVRITGVKTTVTPLDIVLTAASAVIPTFNFTHWEYPNLNEVLIYPGTFSEAYELDGNNKNVLGMVGNGPMQHVMILSQQALRLGFGNKTDKENTAIHEFVHLLDKADGSVDGVPEALLQHAYVLPWLHLVHKNIAAIDKGDSDINVYGATNEAEFLAVVAEYFFERPALLQQKHPELYVMMNRMFKGKKS